MTDSNFDDIDLELARYGRFLDVQAPPIQIDELNATVSMRGSTEPPRRGRRRALVAAASLMVIAAAVAALTRATHDRGTVSTATTTSSTSETTSVPVGTTIGRLSIPSIGVDVDVREGIDDQTLQDGPGRVPSSAPLGSNGRSIVFAHRTTYSAPFADIDKLEPGATITIQTSTDEFTYRVRAQADGTGNRIVPPDAIFGPTPTPTLTLESYNPKYSASSRIVVDADLVSPDSDSTSNPSVSGTLRMVGGPLPGIDRTVDGTVEAQSSDGSIAAHVTVGTDGRFNLSLAPGTYALVGHSPQFNDGTVACQLTSSAVVVVAGHSATVDVICPVR